MNYIWLLQQLKKWEKKNIPLHDFNVILSVKVKNCKNVLKLNLIIRQLWIQYALLDKKILVILRFLLTFSFCNTTCKICFTRYGVNFSPTNQLYADKIGYYYLRNIFLPYNNIKFDFYLDVKIHTFRGSGQLMETAISIGYL